MLSRQAMSIWAGRPSPATVLLQGAHKPAHRASIIQNRIVPRAGLLDFLSAPTGAKGNKRRATEIVDELLELSAGTEGGLKASSSVREDIVELVDELESYCPKAPLRSELIFGEWEVFYASKPQTAGGPFRSPLGRAVFPGQRVTQVISPPNVCVNEVSYKTLGFLSGAARQEGEIEPLDEKTFQLTFPSLDGKKSGGPRERVIEVAYLDERIRVARALPQDESQEASFYVFRRVDANTNEEGAEEEGTNYPARASPITNSRQKASKKKEPTFTFVDDEPAPQPVARRSPFGTQIFGKKEGMATQAERAYMSKNTGRGKPTPAPPAPQRTNTRTVIRKSPAEIAAERAAAKAAAEEERRITKERAAAAKAAAEEERRKAREMAERERQRAREAAEAERIAMAKKREASKAQYDQLSSEAAELSTAAKDAAAAVKGAERETAGLLRRAGQARRIIASAMATAEAAAQNLKDGVDEEFEAEKVVLERQRLVNELEKRLRQQAAALAPRVR